MTKRYDLLETETGNLVGRFTGEDEALAFVCALIEANGEDVIETIVLGGGMISVMPYQVRQDQP